MHIGAVEPLCATVCFKWTAKVLSQFFGPHKTQRHTTVPMYIEICRKTTDNSVIITVQA